MNDQLDRPDTVETLEPPKSLKPISETGPSISSKQRAKTVAEARPSRIQPPAPVRARTAFDDNDDDNEDDTFFGRHKVKLAIAAVVFVVSLTTYLIKNSGDTRPRKAPERMVMIQVAPPPPAPPPPPPPPKVEPPKMEEKMIEQAPVEEEPEQKPADEPPAISTGIKGDGPGMAGLSSKGGPLGLGGSGSGRGRGGPFDAFARSASSRIRSQISTHPKTRSAKIPSCELRLWVDSTGRVIRAKLSSSSGDPATDAAIQNEVLPGMQLDAPPPGMPMPIVLRVSARRPT